MSEKPKIVVINVNVEPKHSPKYETHTHSTSTERKTLASIAAAALLVGGIAIGGYASAETPKSSTTAAVSEVDKQQAQIAKFAQTRAKSIADAINKTIDNSGLVVTTPVLNGAIVRKFPSSSGGNDAGAIMYEDAYLLYTPYSQQPDTIGNFLNGAWIGLSSNDKSGAIAISPIEFDPNTMAFVANHTGDPVIDVSIMTTPINNLSGHSAYEASVAYGPAGDQNPRNNDGTPITPGLRVGM